MMMKIPIDGKKPQKRYRLYCPSRPSDMSGCGFNSFSPAYIKCEGNVIEHMIRIGEMLEWYQIVDLRDNMKVVKEVEPES